MPFARDWDNHAEFCIDSNNRWWKLTCMISPEMYDEFCWQDLIVSCHHLDCWLYYLDGPRAIRNLTLICAVEKLNSIQ